MKLAIELTENDIRRIIADHIRANYDLNIKAEDVPIQVKSKQNYKSEWEEAEIRVSSIVLAPPSQR